MKKPIPTFNIQLTDMFNDRKNPKKHQEKFKMIFGLDIRENIIYKIFVALYIIFGVLGTYAEFILINAIEEIKELF